MQNKVYAGVGSRKTSPEALLIMEALGERFAREGWLLRSGAAQGADQAFERGCDLAAGKKEIWLPWADFGRSKSRNILTAIEKHHQVAAGLIASEIHPAWSNCSAAARLLHTRNILQVLGADLTAPAALTICWTEGGKTIGGTATAILLSEKHGIPVVNLASQDWREKLQGVLNVLVDIG